MKIYSYGNDYAYQLKQKQEQEKSLTDKTAKPDAEDKIEGRGVGCADEIEPIHETASEEQPKTKKEKKKQKEQHSEESGQLP